MIMAAALRLFWDAHGWDEDEGWDIHGERGVGGSFLLIVDRTVRKL